MKSKFYLKDLFEYAERELPIGFIDKEYCSLGPSTFQVSLYENLKDYCSEIEFENNRAMRKYLKKQSQ
jgi:hypothetical protein